MEVPGRAARRATLIYAQGVIEMTMQITRRRLLAGTAVALAALAIVQRRVLAATTLTLGHGAAPGNPRAVAAQEFAKLVEQKTNGEVSVNIAGSEQLGNDVAMLLPACALALWI
jgi:TRAP-type C4-dicarboxylate transport system substrate-binding protein